VCDSAVETTAGGLTTGWWAVLWECFSSHPLWYLWLETNQQYSDFGFVLRQVAVKVIDLKELGFKVPCSY